MGKRGFTLIEVLIALTIITIIGTMMVYAYGGSLKASRDLYFKEQTKLSLLEYMDYCANNPLLAEVIDKNEIYNEKHILGINLFNDGINSRLSSFFGPIDISSLETYSLVDDIWVPVSAVATESGAITIVGIHDEIKINYKLLGWNYIKDNRFNYGNNIFLSYINSDIKFVSTSDGINIPIGNITVVDVKDSNILINTEQNKWINIYYQVPRDIIFKIYRPNLQSYTIEDNILKFNNWAANHYILINYQTVLNIHKIEILKISDQNSIVFSESILKINNIKCLTIEGIAEWGVDKNYRKIAYITMVRENE